MASYTDIIPQFNPYIQQLPVEAMVHVGMEKQRRYDEGVQKIQSQIDNIAGLDIMKPIHRQYLQSKLNELGNNLKTVAGADFSNFQLVNSVGGMTNQIVKDPTIQNAIYSTQKAREQMGVMDSAIKEGKSSPENEWWFNNQINSWLSDGNLNSQFNSRYVQYRDVDKKLRDVADKIKEIDSSVDIPYRRDAKGNVLTDKNGNPIIDDAILNIKVKGKPAQKILNNFYDSLDEGDKQQLMITANYHYRNATVDTFRNDINQTYIDQKDALGKQVADWAVSLNTNPNLTAADRAKVRADMTDAQRILSSGELERARDEKLAQVGSGANLPDYKYQIYTQKYLTNLAKDISYQSYSYEYKNNPYAQMNMERERLNLQAAKYRQEHEEFLLNYGLAQTKLMLEESDRQRKRMGIEPIVSPLTLPTDGTRPGLENVNALIQRDQNAIDQIKSIDGPKIFPEIKNPSEVVGRTADGKPITKVQKAVDDLVNTYLTNPDPNAPYLNSNSKRLFVERIRALQISKSQNDALLGAATNFTRGYDEQIKKQLAGQPGITIKGERGSTTYTAQDMYELSNVYNNNIKSYKGAGGYGPSSVSLNEEAFINRYAGTRLEPLAKAYVKNFKGQSLTSAETQMLTAARNVWSKNNSSINDIVNEKMSAQSDFLAKRMPQVQAYGGTLDMTNDDIKRTVNNLLGNKFIEYSRLGSLDVYKKGEFDPDTVQSWQSGKGAGDLKYTIEKDYSGAGKLVIYKGTEKQTVPLTSGEMGQFFPQFSRRNPVTDIKYRVLGSSNFTTNVTGGDDPVNAFMSGYDIDGIANTPLAPLVRLDVRGASSNDGGDGDLFEVKMYVNDNGVWKSSILNKKGYVNEDGLDQIMKNIGSATVADVLKYGQ